MSPRWTSSPWVCCPGRAWYGDGRRGGVDGCGPRRRGFGRGSLPAPCQERERQSQRGTRQGGTPGRPRRSSPPGGPRRHDQVCALLHHATSVPCRWFNGEEAEPRPLIRRPRIWRDSLSRKPGRFQRPATHTAQPEATHVLRRCRRTLGPGCVIQDSVAVTTSAPGRDAGACLPRRRCEGVVGQRRRPRNSIASNSATPGG